MSVHGILSLIACAVTQIRLCIFKVSPEHFTPDMVVRPLDVKKIKPIMFYEGINAKVFRRSVPFAIAVVETSHSSSFEYTISVH